MAESVHYVSGTTCILVVHSDGAHVHVQVYASWGFFAVKLGQAGLLVLMAAQHAVCRMPVLAGQHGMWF